MKVVAHPKTEVEVMHLSDRCVGVTSIKFESKGIIQKYLRTDS